MISLLFTLFISVFSIGSSINTIDDPYENTINIHDTKPIQNAYVDNYNQVVVTASDYMSSDSFKYIYNYFNNISLGRGYKSIEEVENAWLSANEQGENWTILKIVNMGDIHYDYLLDTPNDYSTGLYDFGQTGNPTISTNVTFQRYGSLSWFIIHFQVDNRADYYSYLDINYVLRYYSDTYQVIQTTLHYGHTSYNPLGNFTTYIDNVFKGASQELTQRFAFILPHYVNNDVNYAFSILANPHLGLPYSEGYGVGYDAGFKDGRSQGYQEGLADGLSDYDYDATALTIFSGIMGIALVPINMFLQIFNFEILGINLSGFISGILTVAVVVIIIRMITGGKKDD